MPKLKRSEGNNPYPQLETLKDCAYYWNESVHPEVNANELYKYDEKGAKVYVKNGFGFVMTRQNDGVIQGSGALVAVGNEEKSQFAKEHKSAFFSFRKGISRQKEERPSKSVKQSKQKAHQQLVLTARR